MLSYVVHCTTSCNEMVCKTFIQAERICMYRHFVSLPPISIHGSIGIHEEWMDGLIADSARVVGARLLHSQHHIAVGNAQYLMHITDAQKPWVQSMEARPEFLGLDEVSVVGSHCLGLALGHLHP